MSSDKSDLILCILKYNPKLFSCYCDKSGWFSTKEIAKKLKITVAEFMLVVENDSSVIFSSNFDKVRAVN